jgi:hypothetical protein
MYNKTTWVDGVTPANADNMNKIEDGVKDLDTKVGTLITYQSVLANINTYTLDLSKGENFSIETTDTNAKTLAFSNIPTVINCILTVTIKLKYTNTASIIYPASVKWLNGSIPSFTAGKEYLLIFVSYDNGVTWLGYTVGAW